MKTAKGKLEDITLLFSDSQEVKLKLRQTTDSLMHPLVQLRWTRSLLAPVTL